MKSSSFRMLVTIASVASLSVTAAHAQRTGSRIGRDATQEDAPAVVELLAKCIAQRRPGLVRKWFETLPGSPAERADVTAETEDMSLCLDNDRLVMDGKMIAFSAAKMRYPVALAALARLLPASSPTPPAPKDASPWFTAAYAAADKTRLDGNALGLQDFGHCVAVTDWPNTRAFLMSRGESTDEAGAVKRLIPVLGPCLPSDVTISLTPANLRKVLAEPVYHLLMDSKGPRPSTGTL